jgi:hypothetical protein
METLVVTVSQPLNHTITRSGDFVTRAHVHLITRAYGTRMLYGARKLIPPVVGDNGDLVQARLE